MAPGVPGKPEKESRREVEDEHEKQSAEDAETFADFGRGFAYRQFVLGRKRLRTGGGRVSWIDAHASAFL
jgi:hypothetical protein